MATILIAEDEPVVREPIAHVLRLFGHQILTAPDGRAALGMLNGRVVDLLLLDVRMPNMSGLDLLRQIRRSASHAQLPVILLTEAVDRELLLEARQLGVCSCLLKSAFSMDELMRRVNSMLAGEGSRRRSAVAMRIPAAPAHPPATGIEPEPAGSPGTPLSQLRPLIGRATLLERIARSAELRACSPTLAEVRRLSESADASIDQIAGAIRRDHALAVRVLRLANSPAYCRDHPVDSIDRAVVRIGLTGIGQAILNLGLVDQLTQGPALEGLDTRLFWEHSIATGLLAARIASDTGSMAPDAAFTAGLLHDVGRVLLAEAVPDEYATVLRTARERSLPLDLVESQLLVLNHAEAVSQVLTTWKFPRHLIDPIILHHRPLHELRHAAASHLPELLTLVLANRLAHALLLGDSGNDALWPTHELCEMLGLRSETLNAISRQIHRDTAELKAAMLAAMPAGTWPDRRALALKQLGVRLRPLFVATEPALDAFRLLCERLGDPGPPNLGVIHIHDARDVRSVAPIYRETEQRARAERLPLLVLTPAPRIVPDQDLLADRRCAVVTLPATLSAIVRAVRRLLATPAPHSPAGPAADQRASQPAGPTHAGSAAP